MKPSNVPSSLLLQPQKLYDLPQNPSNSDNPGTESLTKSQNEEVINLVQPKNLNSDPFNDAFLGTIGDRQALNEIFGFSNLTTTSVEESTVKIPDTQTTNNLSNLVVDQKPVSPAES